MISTLQRYVGWELLKTFVMTAVGLTLTFTLCGGVLNMIDADMLTAVQLMNILLFVLPIATTLTLPVSALFSCAIVYGRFAADNEFDACKASGINIHRLLLPAVLLSIFTAGFTFAFSNYIIPRFIEQLEVMVRRDLQKIVMSALSTRGYVRHGPYVVYAGQATLSEKGTTSKVINIQNAAFMEFSGDNLARAGTADTVHVFFDKNAETGDPMVEASMIGVRAVDVVSNREYSLQHQPFDPFAITKRVEQKPKWLDLDDLLRYQDQPQNLPLVQSQVRQLRAMMRDAAFYRFAYDQIIGGKKVLIIGDPAQRQYEIQAGWIELDAEDLRPKMGNVVIKERTPEYLRTYKAENASMRVKRGFGDAPDMVHLTLQGTVKVTDSRDPGNVIDRRREELPDVLVPPEVGRLADQVKDEELLRPDGQPLYLGGRIEGERVGMYKELVKLGLEIKGIIHSRLAFSVSSLVMLVLAAGLGIIYRGGQLLTAFIISFIPGLLVVVMNIMGRQLSENTGTHVVGLSIIWGGIVLLAIADVLVLTRYLRR